ncbi:uncharacterized protein Nmag_0117 [Natrialba magadii ATCC 43099]|uniref:Uncharacterized protein n=1 Tax=Natrialba magadii (strain ATCC 43099 / DSM 3394 / CCM 3739 / CIP 104546 / IAM 13178 / JCM 8861 / NBRC 102185 / NCIMB 2190 / MS3) TaxID=547559 RepID=D3SWC3_NATMM|nr:uncharacterized protein Nmag_0117 [Natrialba magadii ATCC 43099]
MTNVEDTEQAIGHRENRDPQVTDRVMNQHRTENVMSNPEVMKEFSSMTSKELMRADDLYPDRGSG